MITKKYKRLALAKHMHSKIDEEWEDKYIKSVTTLKKQDGFSLQVVEYRYGNISNPYLMHDCNPPEELIENAWYGSADTLDNNRCIYCEEPYPTEILTAAKLLNVNMAYRFRPNTAF